jgi:ubiquitin C-terminal hydrolase
MQLLIDDVLSNESLADWRCEACGSKTPDTYRATRMDRMPSYLIVHLVRGVYSPQSGTLVRSKRKV